MIFTTFRLALKPVGVSGILAFGLTLAPPMHASELPLPATMAACASLAGVCEAKADLTLASALRLALEHNRDLAAAAKEIGAQDGAALQAGLFKNPILSVDAEDVQRPERSTTIRVSQLIELGGKRAARVAVSSLAREGAMQDYEIKRRSVTLGVAQSFTELLATQEQLRFAEDSVQLARRVADATSKRVQAGKVSPVEETRARLALASAGIDFEQAKREHGAARRRLSSFWGNPTPQFTQAAGDLEAMVPLPALGTLTERVSTNPTLLRTSKEVAQREAVIELEKSRRAPDVSVSAGIRKYAQGGDNGVQFGLSLPLPLFDRNQGSIIEAQQRLGQARDVQQATETRLMTELAQTYDALFAAETEIKTLRHEVLPAARSAYDAANIGFEYGKFGFLDVLDAQRTLFQNRRLYLRSLANYQRLVTEVEHLIGGPLNGSLNGPPAGFSRDVGPSRQ